MERGPAALFGAIVAVGLGPAMWFGVRLGSVEIAPNRPPATVGEQTSEPDRLVGGAGAADNPVGDTTVIRPKPEADVVRLSASPSPTPSATSSSPISTSPPASPSVSVSPSPTPTEDPTNPSTDPTTEPTVPPTEESSAPAEPPPTQDETHPVVGSSTSPGDG